MEDQQHSIVLLDRTIFQLALQTRDLSQRRDELTLQIKACRADITERKSFIETTQKNIKKLEEETTVKQNTVKHIKDNAKSMKANNRLLQHYEMILKGELEKKRENYNQDKKVYEERIASYRNVFQQHKEFYCKNPLAKQLLAIQSEKEDIEDRIKALEDQIAMKQEHLTPVVGATVKSSLSENQAESVSAQLTEVEPGTQRGHQAEDVGFSIGMASLHLTPTEEVNNRNFTGEEISGDTIDKRSIPETLSYPPVLRSNLESMAQKLPSDQKSGAEQDQQWRPKTQEDPAGSLAREEEMEEMMEEEEEQPMPVADEEDDEVGDDNDQRDTAVHHLFSPPRMNPPSPPGRMKLVPSTPTFSIKACSKIENVSVLRPGPLPPLSSSPSVSPGRGSSNPKSPAFLFSTSSDPSTPSFAGFGFDVGSAQEEDSPFVFTGSYFHEKKSDSKSPSGAGFLFDEPERPEGEFHFSFSSKSPGGSGAGRDKAGEDAFPFSFTYS